MEQIGFVGLGVMGGPMAGHLILAGFDVTVWNRTASKTGPIRAKGGHVALTLSDLAQRCDVICICVNRTEDVESVVHEMASTARPGTLFIDHSTIAPGAAKRLAEELAEKGLKFLDAPITGGSMGAQKGQLTIFVGGNHEDFERAKPVLDAYSKRAERVGPNGAGQLTKLANQIAVAGSLIGLCESLSFAKKAGLDIAQTRELLGGGAAGSWAFDNYGPKVLAEDWTPGFSVKNQRKDFGYCAESAAEIGASIPATLLVDRLLKVLDDEGCGEWTTAALYKVLVESGYEA
jgi:3-hydroxyisobutyrate dehydrogenase-like beta-hydroxyacid dehydrogenase